MTRAPNVTFPTTLLLLLVGLALPGTALGSTGGSPPLPENWTELHDENVPRDGVVAGRSECGPCDVSEVWITTASGTPIEGVATDLSDLRRVGDWAFTPSEPWLPGEYFAHYADGEPASFTVLDTTVEPPTIEPRVGSTTTQRRDHIQCVSEIVTGDAAEEVFATFALSGWTQGFFDVEAFGASASQYTYLVSVNGEVRFGGHSPSTLYEIQPGTNQICYWVRAQRLVSREETLLVDECYSPEQLNEYVREDPGPEEIRAFLRDECVLPPAGFVSEWCSSFQSALDEGSCSSDEFTNVEACESALRVCTNDASGPPSDPDDDDDGELAGGCAIYPTHGSNAKSGIGALFALVAALVALRSKERGTRRTSVRARTFQRTRRFSARSPR